MSRAFWVRTKIAAHDIEGGVDHAPGDIAAQSRDEQERNESRSRPAITLAPSVQVSTMISPNRISARLSAGSRKRLR